MTKRFLRKRFCDSLLIVWGFVFKAATTDLSVCRKLFFDGTVNDDDIQRYMSRFRADSRVTLDISSLTPVLPSVTSMGPDGRANWLSTGSGSDEVKLPAALVIGAEKDFVVDREGITESATYLGVKPVFVPDTYHDVMLGPKWTESAKLIEQWLSSL
jgi:hypothetical protein